MGAFDVFISHDTRDYELALSIHDILYKVGMRPYIYELYPQYRTTIPEGIRDVMKASSVCLVLLTSHGIQSLWVHQELGLAFGYKKIIVPAVETGIDFTQKGFVQLVSHIEYHPGDCDRFAYSVIWALRNEVFGHNPRPVLRLVCANGHEHEKYNLPSTEEINKALDQPEESSHEPALETQLLYECSKCGTEIRVSPWTFQELA